MGKIVTIGCTSCGVSQTLKTGCGVLHSSLAEVVRLFPQATQKEVLEQTSGEMFPVFDFSFQIAFCGHCGDFVSIPVLKLPEHSLEYIGVCEKCKNQADLIGHNENKTCPICRNGVLNIAEAGFWD